MMQEQPDDTRSAADRIAAHIADKATAAPEPAPPEPGPEVAPWAPEEWRAGKFLVVRYLPIEGTPQLKRQVYGSGRMGNYSTPFESRDAAAKMADKLNEEDSNDE